MPTDIDQLLHDADRKVMGAGFARRVGDTKAALRMDTEAGRLYKQAIAADEFMRDPAWKEGGNRDRDWLLLHGFEQILLAAAQHEEP